MSVKPKVAITAGTLFAIVACYLLSIELWVSKWEQPGKPLPEDHLAHEQIVNHDPSGAALAAALQQHLRDTASDMQSVSMSGAMSLNGKLVWSGTIGLQDVEQGKPATIDTLYRIGSVSKPLTAVAMMRMADQGLIDLDAPIQQYLPDYPETAPMTVRQLASHTAGIRHYGLDLTRFPPTDGYSNDIYPDVNAALQQFQNDRLEFAPGEDFKYSTHGYTLLSAVLQAAAGRPFNELVRELVLEPTDMTVTSAEFLDHQTEHLAGFYTSDGGLYGNTPAVHLSNKLAGGGYISTPTDLVRFGGALLNGDLLSKDRFDEMVTPQPLADGSENPQAYALGWRHHLTSNILGEDNKVDVIHHGGVSTGSDSFLLLVPDHNISVAITTNGHGDRSRREIQMLAYRIAADVIEDQQIAKNSDQERSSAS